MERNYVIKCGDDYLIWIEAGAEMDAAAKKCERLAARRGGKASWREVDGNRWMWSGRGFGHSRFTWQEARDIVWNKLKSLTTDGLGNRTEPPRPDRWRYKLVRIVPRGDTIRPANKRGR